jgi:hypothetical protein
MIRKSKHHFRRPTYNDLGFADSERIFFTITSQIKGDCNADGGSLLPYEKRTDKQLRYCSYETLKFRSCFYAYRNFFTLRS